GEGEARSVPAWGPRGAPPRPLHGRRTPDRDRLPGRSDDPRELRRPRGRDRAVRPCRTSPRVGPLGLRLRYILPGLGPSAARPPPPPALAGPPPPPAPARPPARPAPPPPLR